MEFVVTKLNYTAYELDRLYNITLVDVAILHTGLPIGLKNTGLNIILSYKMMDLYKIILENITVCKYFLASYT